jgi:hypothetical protein
MGHMGNRKPEKPLFMLIALKSGSVIPWLLSRESEVKGMGGIIIAREFEHVYSFEPYMNGTPSIDRDVDEVS